MQNPKSSSLLIGCFAIGGLVAIVFGILFAVVLYGISSGRLASLEALPQGRIPANQLAEVSQIVSLRPNEQILYFYCAAMTVADDGNLFTNERVISYTTDDGSLSVFDAEYREIESAELRRSGTWLDESTIDVLLKDGTALMLWVSPENDGDKDFYAKLIAQLERHHATQDTVTKR
ncbi:hypothetical protein K227x_17100 [Rubripirellula lacrimiformis]|uniref:Uncharacterized protein n=1 Tax=Rubripirellula lacrimiformis TaxID=1930273 RepID=A0A517N8J5_9BACT|nr:hypothetical protein [Rubripirellula lacrimiformis]QDT03328.1 hypothetical protein K227x_17100 [Rubripirellula lacrimiformis]